MAEQQDDLTEVDDDTTSTTAPEFIEPTEPPKPAAPKIPTQQAADSAADSAQSGQVSRAEFDRLARELRIATKEARERKARIAELEAASASEAERAVMQARQEAAAEREAALRPAVVRANAKAALSSAGCTDPKVQATLMRLIDSGRVEFGDDGDIVAGLDEQVEDLRAQFPEKFATARAPRVPSAREVDAGDKKAPAVKKTATQQQVDRLFGGGRS